MGKLISRLSDLDLRAPVCQIPTKGNDIPPGAVPAHGGPNGQQYIARGLLGVNLFVDVTIPILICRIPFPRRAKCVSGLQCDVVIGYNTYTEIGTTSHSSTEGALFQARRGGKAHSVRELFHWSRPCGDGGCD